MITGEIKNKIDRIWDVFWEGGLSNPLTVVEQLTYLLFIKGLDDLQSSKEANAQLLDLPVEEPIYNDDQRDLRWGAFKELEAEQMYSLFMRQVEGNPGVFEFIKNLGSTADSAFARYMKDALFQIQSPKMLQKVVEMLDTIPMTDRDTKGDIYEYLLSKIATSGTLGQFRTPRHIIDLMVGLMKPTPQDTIIDPASGSCGFLVSANNYLRQNHAEIFTDQQLNHHFNNEMFYGHDMDSTMLRIGAMNMMLHGVENPNIDRRDSLGEDNKDAGRYSLILANPPFKGALDYDACSKSLLEMCKTKKTELLFIALMVRSLKLGGRCAVIVPDGVLFGSSKAHKEIRTELVENQKLEAVISMPSGVFKPYAGVSTAILIFTKTNEGGTDKVWFYDMQNDGFSLDDKRDAIEGSDIPDILSRYASLGAPSSSSASSDDKNVDFQSSKEEGHNESGLENAECNSALPEEKRKRTEQSFLVPKDEIKENAYDLSINRYKEIVYEEVHYDEPQVILDRIDKIEKEITQGVGELRGMLS